MIAKTFEFEMLYRIHEISTVLPLKKVYPRDKDYQSDRNDSDNTPKKTFSEVLKKTQQKEQAQSPTVYTCGYNKNAHLYYNFINQKEYVQEC